MLKFLISTIVLTATTAVTFGEPVAVKDFDSIKLYTLKNKSGASVGITNYGARVTSIIVPDRNGKMGDVALGYHSVETYMNAVDKPYFGSIVGRYGNRIAKGKFSIDGEDYKLATNNGANHLHGGKIGFDKVVWDATPTTVDGNPAVKLTYLAKDGEEGYPGNLNITATYSFSEKNELKISYHATTDKKTPVNLTNHTYFNLAGEGNGDILNHQLHLNASHYTPVDETLIPTGKIEPVIGTPFDFTTAKSIGQDLGKELESKNEQLSFGRGYDHNFVLDKEPQIIDAKLDPNKPVLSLAATVYEPTSGRYMEAYTTEPGVQFYCGNFLDGRLKGKAGKPYIHRSGFVLETQHYPDSPNQPNFPNTILKPGDTYKSTTVYRFSAKK